VRSRPLSIINKVYEASQSDSSRVNMGRREGDRKKPFRVA
jgi:hypothetical protein